MEGVSSKPMWPRFCERSSVNAAANREKCLPCFRSTRSQGGCSKPRMQPAEALKNDHSSKQQSAIYGECRRALAAVAICRCVSCHQTLTKGLVGGVSCHGKMPQALASKFNLMPVRPIERKRHEWPLDTGQIMTGPESTGQSDRRLIARTLKVRFQRGRYGLAEPYRAGMLVPTALEAPA